MPNCRRSTARVLISRMVWLLAAFALAVGTALIPAAASASPSLGDVSVSGMRVDDTTNPLGIDDPHPSLSWQLTSQINGEYQSHYRILVATSASDVSAGIGNIWDTGEVASGNSVGILYGGPALASGQIYYWAVQAWDEHGTASAWSSPAQWEMGLLNSADWQSAQWISPNSTSADAPLLRKDFTLAKPIAKARAYVSGLGFYELHLNGGKVGDQVLAGPSTPYAQRDLYSTYDVTAELQQGTNTVGLWLGNGYDAAFSPYGFRWLGPKQAVVLIEVTFTDGTRQAVTSDNSWKWTTSPITGNDIYNGESYDARLNQPGWDTSGLNDSAWQPVQSVAAPGGSLEAETMPPITVAQTLNAVKLTEPQPGTYVYDFGQNIAGWEVLSTQGPTGSTVKMQTAEELLGNGTIDTTTNRNAQSTDTYTLAGTGSPETYEPRFTYHGFRYVQVTGDPQTPTPGSLQARVVHADLTATSTFSSSDALLDQIWQNNQQTMINNQMSTPTDNPVRDERTPPGMDVQAYHDASTVEFDMDTYYANYLRDMPPGTALPNDSGNAQQPDMGGDQVTLAWTLYQQYGDLATLAANYPLMKKFVDTNAANVPGYVWSTGFGDWCPPDHSANANGGLGNPNAGNCTSEVPIVNTALSYIQALDVARAATALGQSADSAHYGQLAGAIKQAFNAAFINADNASYGDGRETTSILPLAFGMVPAADVPAVGARLVDTVLTGNGGHLDTGIFGTRYLLDALAAVGRTDLAMTALDQTSYPSFGYEIGKGATTDWEQWTYASNMESHDHAMFAGVNASLYTQLAGIQPTGPGYSTVNVAPQIPAGLQHVAAAIDTVRGTIASSWTVTGNQVVMSVTVPVGTNASVRVPNFGQGNTTTATPASGASQQSVTGTGTTYSVGSGTWQFTGTLVPASSTSLSGTWTPCATETNTCSFTGTQTVAFGAQGKYHYATETGGVACSNSVFGDPDSGVSKACYIEPAPTTSGAWQQCAAETGTCSFAGTETVAFGAQSDYNYATATGGAACNDATFGDPDQGVSKACSLQAPPPVATTWTPCSAETIACTFTGTHDVAFGADGHYAYGTFTGATPCDDAVFGDPAPGQVKACYVQ
ncbi:alpha-L-rhamnosidase [Catenulispora sp. EB89]|uniref:family 78 glycoside hydrolase catalytic domain n=1 Tax=Catenulispora sp. EB89 TaxID=3156257 RepID=UPI0035145505